MNTPTSTRTSDPHATALHLLCVSGRASIDDLRAEVGSSAVDELQADGLVATRGSLALLTPEGREAHRQAISREIEELGCRPTLERCYRAFMPINGDVLQICTDWQIRMVNGSPVTNDHRDAAYDADVIRRLQQAYNQVGRLLDELADTLPRFDTYRADLAHAMECVLDGNTEFITNPRVRCFHTIWFELHEDLLATLGLDRGDEDAA